MTPNGHVEPPTSEFSILAAAAAAILIWGATAVVTKVAVGTMDPIAVGLLRTVLAVPMALPVILLRRLAPPRGRRQISLVAATAASGLIGFPLLFTVGIHLTSAAHGALVLAALPLFTGFFAALVERTAPPGRWWLGCAVALIGEVVLMTSRTDLETGGASVLGDCLVIGAAICASLSYVAGARLEQAGYSSWGTTFWGALGAGILLAPVLILLPDQSWMDAGAGTWAGVLYLAAGSTILAYVAWYWALGKGGIGRVGIIQFLQPVVGVTLAVIVLGDPVTLPLLTGAVAILGGVFIAQRRQPVTHRNRDGA